MAVSDGRNLIVGLPVGMGRRFAVDPDNDLLFRQDEIQHGTNGRDPGADVFAEVAARAGRTFWLNPEPRLYWNYGDSVMAAYERYCDGAFECWTTKHLEGFVNVIAGSTRAE